MIPSSINMEEYRSFAHRVEETMKVGSTNNSLFEAEEGVWSPYEIFIHIIDAEVVYYQRIKRVLTEEGAEIPGWNQSGWIASEGGEEMADIDTDLRFLKAVRSKLAKILEFCDEKDWMKVGIHPRDGKYPLEKLIHRQVNHAEGHLKTLKSKV